MNIDTLRTLLAKTRLTPPEIDAFIEMAQKAEAASQKARDLGIPTPINTGRTAMYTGYYAVHGSLRHTHNIDGGTPQWHDAANVHPATPTIHDDCNAFDHTMARWAKANSDLPDSFKAHLIAEAKAAHDTNKEAR